MIAWRADARRDGDPMNAIGLLARGSTAVCTEGTLAVRSNRPNTSANRQSRPSSRGTIAGLTAQLHECRPIRVDCGCQRHQSPFGGVKLLNPAIPVKASPIEPPFARGLLNRPSGCCNGREMTMGFRRKIRSVLSERHRKFSQERGVSVWPERDLSDLLALTAIAWKFVRDEAGLMQQ